MKKIIVILLCLLYVCGSVLSVAASMPMPPEPDDPNSDGTIHLKDIKEYKRWLRTEKLPSDFVCYEQISSLGEFVQFSLTKTYAGDIYSYRYTLRDEIGERLCISFARDKKDYGNEKLYTADDVSNIHWMTSLKEDAKGKAVIQQVHWNGITYHYFGGQLGAIGFVCANWHCQLWRTYDPKDTEKIKAMLPPNGQEATEEEAAKYNLAVMPTHHYPKDSETAFARFLNKNTAETGLQSLLMEIEQNRYEPVPWVEIAISTLSGAVVATLVTFLLMRKKAKISHRFGGNEVDNGMSDAESLSSSNETAPPVS